MRILFLNIVVNFLAWNGSPSSGEVVNVYIVLNFCQLRGLLLWWKLLASSLRFLFSVLYAITISHLYFYFSSSPLDVLKKGIQNWWLSPPPSLANPTIHSWKPERTCRIRANEGCLKPLLWARTYQLLSLCCSPRLTVTWFSVRHLEHLCPFPGNLSNNGV